jgi:hypothetical protein
VELDRSIEQAPPSSRPLHRFRIEPVELIDELLPLDVDPLPSRPPNPGLASGHPVAITEELAWARRQ